MSHRTLYRTLNNLHIYTHKLSSHKAPHTTLPHHLCLFPPSPRPWRTRAHAAFERDEYPLTGMRAKMPYPKQIPLQWNQKSECSGRLSNSFELPFLADSCLCTSPHKPVNTGKYTGTDTDTDAQSIHIFSTDTTHTYTHTKTRNTWATSGRHPKRSNRN